MAAFRVWVRALRPLAQGNLALPLALGQAAAFLVHGTFDLGIAVLVHLFGLADHAVIVLANEYGDRATDDGSTTLVSGGSGVIVDGSLRAESVRRASIVAGIVLIVLTTALVFLRPLLLLAGPAALLVLWAYSFPPLDLSRRGGGEWLQALGMGLGLPGLAYYAQSGDPFVPAFLAFPSIALAYASHVLTAIPDERSDAAAGKRTVVVRRGRRTALAFAMAAAGVGGAGLFVPTLGRDATLAMGLAAFAVASAWLGMAPLLRPASAVDDGRRAFLALVALEVPTVAAIAAWIAI